MLFHTTFDCVHTIFASTNYIQPDCNIFKLKYVFVWVSVIYQDDYLYWVTFKLLVYSFKTIKKKTCTF